ncbi:YesL family protein [Shouchella shacheensis]|uniref:YesL family protein n=1 Tax=Shouchella shacheensis TaxID=1649580 RepID=UPI00073FB29A|nr:YesL family protein [Shouchella shacheensis]
METGGFMGGLYKLSEWIMRLAILNLLWIGFTLAGLVLFGLFPATAAAYAITRQWIRGESDLPLFKTFCSYFFKDFWRVQALGYILTAITIILYIDILFIFQSSNAFLNMLFIPLLLLCVVFAITAMYAFSVFAHYELSIPQVLKHSVLHVLVRPFLSIGMLVTVGALFYAMQFLPGVIPVFGVSVPILTIMWFSHSGFVRNEEKRERIA